ncbi:hypothetical protein JW899_01050 [Candidatus Uhrbacteria bacterium]|nr:hypothetical protein [Candidatus Uhrbacteria bacterium]
MKDISQVYFRTQEKKKRKNELSKMIRDELSHNGEYQQLTEELRILRDKRKSIENGVRADLSDAGEIDVLKMEIGAAQELMSDIALTMYASGQTVEIRDDELGVRMTPVFSVRFRKENIESDRP